MGLDFTVTTSMKVMGLDFIISVVKQTNKQKRMKVMGLGFIVSVINTSIKVMALDFIVSVV